MSAARPIRVGVIGTGFSAESHADALRRLPGVQLAAIASRSPDRAAEAARRHGAARAYENPEQLIDDQDVDAVHVCTVNRLHSDLSARALAAGKHVVTEKPLGTDSKSTARLAQLASSAASSGTLAAVCFNYRHYGVIQQLRAMLTTAERSPVHFVHGSYLQDWLLYDTDWSWRLDPAENGASRAIADIGSHWIDLVQYVSGERVTEVFADLATHHSIRQRPTRVQSSFQGADRGDKEPVSIASEDFGTVMIRFQGGARGVFAVSQVSPGRKNRLTFQIDTADTAFAWNQEHPNTAWIGRRDECNLEYLRAPANAAPAAFLPEGHPEGWRDALRNMCAEFYANVEALSNGTAPRAAYASFSEGHRTTLLVEAILESHRSGTWVGVADRDRAHA